MTTRLCRSRSAAAVGFVLTGHGSSIYADFGGPALNINELCEYVQVSHCLIKYKFVFQMPHIDGNGAV